MNVKTGEMEYGNRRGQIHDLQQTERGRAGNTEIDGTEGKTT